MTMAIKKRKHPQFLRPNYGRSSRSRIKRSWRRQRGIDNKKRLKIKYMGASPSIGYGQPSAIRGLHPRGLPEVLVQSPSELEELKGALIRIAGGVGRLKREAIEKLAAAKGLHVLNPKEFGPKQKRMEEKERREPAEHARKGDAPTPVEKEPEAPAQAAEKPAEREKMLPGGKRLVGEPASAPLAPQRKSDKSPAEQAKKQ
jgi:large subunit ribosomal protein L32e